MVGRQPKGDTGTTDGGNKPEDFPVPRLEGDNVLRRNARKKQKGDRRKSGST